MAKHFNSIKYMDELQKKKKKSTGYIFKFNFHAETFEHGFHVFGIK